MRFSSATTTYILLLLGSLAVDPVQSRLNKQQQQQQRQEKAEGVLHHVIVRMKEGDFEDRPILKLLSNVLAAGRETRLHRINAIATEVTDAELQELQNDPDVLFVEDDPMVYPDGEAIQYGLDLVQAESPLIPTKSGNVPTTAACNDPNSFKIGIIDSGLAVDHPDIACTDIKKKDSNCIGKEFGLDSGDGLWHNPIVKYHGTHVAGTVGASDLNNEGIKGVISDGNLCFVIGRVFGEAGGGARMSSIYAAVEWMMDQGVNIINMSLGGGDYNENGEDIMVAAYEEGALLIAAAGNEGTKSYHYPANFKKVMSVSAIDASLERAGFSQFNDGVDIAAPGVSILSTYPLNLGGAVLISAASVGAIGKFMERLTSKPDKLSGVLVDCPNFGIDPCPGDGKHICLIERGGGKTFEEKTLSCEANGGAAAIIFNNKPGPINGGVSTDTKTTIPVLEVTQADGERLKNGAIDEPLTFEVKKGYSYLSGTSMAVPHVSGVAGKVWRACPACSNKEVESCLYSSALDIGDSGKDEEFGNGLVQAEAAYECLTDTVECCVQAGASQPPPPAQSPTTAPSSAPSAMPTPAPSSAPTDTPTDKPTPAPVVDPPQTEQTGPVWSGRGEDLVQIMYAIWTSAADFATGDIDESTLTNDLSSLVTTDVKYHCSYVPVDAQLQPYFAGGSGVDHLVGINTYQKANGEISMSYPQSIATGNGVVYYQQTMNGTFLSGGASVEWDAVTRLSTDDNGNIIEILQQVVDPSSIDQAYP